ncbi:MAG: PEGA domain-containing protein [Leptospiraceae bacterium]|nr:PEGA domain-containing protein [Leptospiraceae bacterium]
MQKVLSFFLIYIFLFVSHKSLLPVDQVYDFPSRYLPEKIVYEKFRKVCIFPFRTQVDNPDLKYLSGGLPAVIYAGFSSVKSVYDSDPLPVSIQHEYGDPKNEIKEKETKKYKKANPDTGKPEFIKIKMEFLDKHIPIFSDQSIRAGRENDCYYMITGEYTPEGKDSLKIEIEFTERRKGKSKSYIRNTTIKRSFQEMQNILPEIRTDYFIRQPAFVTITSEPESGFFVFIDGDLAGKTPLENHPVLPGDRNIEVFYDNYRKINRVVKTVEGSLSRVQYNLKKFEWKGKLTVNCNIEGAEVYLGNKLIGETPLKESDVPTGQNRIRITKKGYVDYLGGVEIKEEETLLINAVMREGDSDTYYNNDLNVFQDYSYFDFGMYSLYGTIFFYGIYMYSGLKISKEEDKMYNKSIFNTLTYYQGLSSALTNGTGSSAFQEFTGALAYQQYYVDSLNANTAKYYQYQNASIAGALTMLTLSGIFLYTGLNREAMELGFHIPRNPNEGAEAHFQYNFKF